MISARGIFSIDWRLVIPVLLLIVFGLATLFAINPIFFRSQLLFVIISFFAFFFIANSNFRMFEMYSLPIYVISVILLVIVLILGIETRGAVRWIDFFGIRIQFSEIVKPLLLVSLATYLGSKETYSLKTFFTVGLFSLFVVMLIFLQPDLGTALIFAAVVVLVLLHSGFPLKWFALLLVLGIGTTPFFWQLLHDYQRQRFLTFFHPTSDPLGTSYNAVQAIVAVGSGLFFGKGLGQATQSGLRFLPERHTDFIYASLVESFGFVGGLLVLLLFAYLLYNIFSLYLSARERTHKLFIAGAFFLLLIQVFFNIGMNIGLLPVVGVTLPFLSSGGSSMLANFMLLGLLVSLRRNLRDETALEIR